jgi:hypothetical protein
MPCGVLEFVDGGTFRDAQLNDPRITSGRAENTELNHGRLTGGVVLDDETILAMAAALRDPLAIPAYLDCNGAAIPETGRVASCDNLNAKVAEATDPARIAATFLREDGTAMAPGVKLMTASEVVAAIDAALCDAGVGDDKGAQISSLTWDLATKTVTVTEVIDGVQQTPHTVALTGLMSSPGAVWPAAPTAPQPSDAYLPMSVYGGRTCLLGTPTRFIQVVFEGVTGWIPFYQGA